MRGCGRIQRPAFPAPSDVSDGESTSKTRAHRAARSRRCGCERRGWFTSPRLRGEVGDGAKQKSPGEGDYPQVRACRESPLTRSQDARDLSPQAGRGEERGCRAMVWIASLALAMTILVTHCLAVEM